MPRPVSHREKKNIATPDPEERLQLHMQTHHNHPPFDTVSDHVLVNFVIKRGSHHGVTTVSPQPTLEYVSAADTPFSLFLYQKKEGWGYCASTETLTSRNASKTLPSRPKLDFL